MIANMAQTQNFPQPRKNVGILHGGSFHNSSPPPQPNSSIGSFANSLGGPRDSRNSEVQGLGRSSLQWQSPAASSDVHMSNRWQNNSNESSAHAGQPVDPIFSAYSELFENSACTSKDGQQHLMDASASYSASLASSLPGGSPGLGRSVSGNGISSPLGGSLVSGSRRLGQGWNSSMDHGNLSLTVDPSKGGFALQGVGHPPSQPLSRFSTNPGFAERAAMFSPFGNGQFSPSFPLAENGSVRRSPAFESDNKRVNGSVSTPRSELVSSPCPTEAPARNSAPHSNAPEVRGADRTREDGNGNGKGEVAVPASIRVPARLGGSPVDQEDRNVGPDADEIDRASSDSEASDFSRGQEASCADEAAADLVRTASVKKRKSSFAEEPGKEAPSPISKEQKTKRCKDSEGAGEKDEQRPKAEWSGSENSGLSNSPAVKDCSKTAEQPKLDYIHVRARRGQATDSHSLAERVRREKISERMKFLQDLVPGCSKVTGKAVMLDEIINYVQSMQRQVASLSMKLAAVTPPADFNIDSVLSKQLQIGHGYGLPSMVEHPDSSLSYPHVQSQTLQQLQHGGIPVPEFQPASDINLRILNGSAPQLSRNQLETYDDGLSQATSLWDGDLQSIVQMGYGQHMQGFSSGGLQCDLPPGHMKMEL